MWIVFFQGQPAFWLTGGKAYRVGKHSDCELQLQEDKSISRMHVTVSVGLGPLQEIPDWTPDHGEAAENCSEEGGDESALLLESVVSPISLIDTSTYGTTVTPVRVRWTDGAVEPQADEGSLPTSTPGGGAHSYVSVSSASVLPGLAHYHLPPWLRPHQMEGSEDVPPTPANAERAVSADGGGVSAVVERLKLPKAMPYALPTPKGQMAQDGFTAFQVHVGHNGTALLLVWVELVAAVEDIPSDMKVKLAHQLQKCGIRLLHPSRRQRNGSPGVRFDYTVMDYAHFYITDGFPLSAVALRLLCRGFGADGDAVRSSGTLPPVVAVGSAYFSRLLEERRAPSAAAGAMPQPPPPRRFPPSEVDGLWASLLQRLEPEPTHTNLPPPSVSVQPLPLLLDRLSRTQTCRATLFSAFKFIVLQRRLWEELQAYVPAAGGELVYDALVEQLLSPLNGSSALPLPEESAATLVDRYSGEATPRSCLLLYNRDESTVSQVVMRVERHLLPSPFTDRPGPFVVSVSQGIGGVAEYGEVVQSLVCGVPLLTVMSRSRGEAHSDNNAEKEVPSQGKEDGSQAPRYSTCAPLFGPPSQERGADAGGSHPCRQVQEEGWVLTSTRPRRFTASRSLEVMRALPPSATALAAYPCFASHFTSGSVVPATKKFRKQEILAPLPVTTSAPLSRGGVRGHRGALLSEWNAGTEAEGCTAVGGRPPCEEDSDPLDLPLRGLQPWVESQTPDSEHLFAQCGDGNAGSRPNLFDSAAARVQQGPRGRGAQSRVVTSAPRFRACTTAGGRGRGRGGGKRARRSASDAALAEEVREEPPPIHFAFDLLQPSGPLRVVPPAPDLEELDFMRDLGMNVNVSRAPVIPKPKQTPTSVFDLDNMF